MTSPNTSVQAGRTVNLHCRGNTSNRFDPPSFDWSRNNIPLQPGTVTVSQTNLGMSYLSVNGTQTEDTGIYTCAGRNNLSTIVRNIAVRVVGEFITNSVDSISITSHVVRQRFPGSQASFLSLGMAWE